MRLPASARPRATTSGCAARVACRPVIYGGDSAPQSISVDDHDLEMILRGAYRCNAIINLTVDGIAQPVKSIVRDLDRHPVNSRLVHVDFQRIDMNKSLEMEMTLHIVGSDPKGVREGGVLEHIQRTVTIYCKPGDIPEALNVDLSDLDMGSSIHVSDLPLPPGVEVLDDPDTTLFSIVAPAKAQEEEEVLEGEAAEGAEPELIGRDKEDAEES